MIATETMHRLWRVGGALLGAGALLALAALTPARVGAEDGCTFAAAVDPGPEDEGATSLTVAPDEPITFWGTFIPNAQVDLFFFHEGAPSGDFTPGIADSDGEFLFVFDFDPHQTGQWRVVASVAETECAGEVLVTVTGPGTTTAPSPTAVPNTALAEDDPRPAESPALTLAVVTVLLAAGLLAPRIRGSR